MLRSPTTVTPVLLNIELKPFVNIGKIINIYREVQLQEKVTESNSICYQVYLTYQVISADKKETYKRECNPNRLKLSG